MGLSIGFAVRNFGYLAIFIFLPGRAGGSVDGEVVRSHRRNWSRLPVWHDPLSGRVAAPASAGRVVGGLMSREFGEPLSTGKTRPDLTRPGSDRTDSFRRGMGWAQLQGTRIDLSGCVYRTAPCRLTAAAQQSRQNTKTKLKPKSLIQSSFRVINALKLYFNKIKNSNSHLLLLLLPQLLPKVESGNHCTGRKKKNTKFSKRDKTSKPSSR